MVSPFPLPAVRPRCGLNIGRLMVGPTIPTPRHRKPRGKDPPMLKSFLNHPQVMSYIHEQSTNHISLRKIGLDVYKVTHYTGCVLPITSSATLRWQRIFKSTVSLCSCFLCSCLSFDMHTLRCALIEINSIWKLQKT